MAVPFTYQAVALIVCPPGPNNMLFPTDVEQGVGLPVQFELFEVAVKSQVKLTAKTDGQRPSPTATIASPIFVRMCIGSPLGCPLEARQSPRNFEQSSFQ